MVPLVPQAVISEHFDNINNVSRLSTWDEADYALMDIMQTLRLYEANYRFIHRRMQEQDATIASLTRKRDRLARKQARHSGKK